MSLSWVLYALTPVTFVVCLLLLIKYVPKLAQLDWSPRWWLCLGICLGFFGSTCCCLVRGWAILQYSNLSASSDSVEAVITGILIQIFAILAAICHLIAATTCVGKRVTRSEILTLLAVTATVVVFLASVAFLVS
jgi:hypothetical protein